ncbi:hypothetical protein Q0Z83_039040 [Actinoplanes sichuanensis]|uniref:Uncharacterized protein n=1 Tax=Actinoplanes sichuanensis TaxID=512349 RepID=A0ABW4AUK1_9ACTN|nr:hypothetical protein [Actinoplanes sichuanensis]BEL05713.1 hypothetical protein Q0Z83_039040 [Actinoplanes sichuanensis]
MTDTPELAQVPITVWHLPPARPGETLSLPVAQRLIVGYTRGHRLILDLTIGEQLARCAQALHRTHARHSTVKGPRRAALIVIAWPLADTRPGPVMAGCHARLASGSCLAVIQDGVDYGVNRTLIGAAHDAGLVYREHIVGVHTDLSVHTDILVFAKP